MPNQEYERERERDQTHSYWYIPSAPRENYSLLVMESTGMMKMAIGEGSPPPPAGCRNRVPIGFWWLQRLAAAELPIYSLPRSFLGYMDIYRRKKYVRGATRAPQGRGAP